MANKLGSADKAESLNPAADDRRDQISNVSQGTFLEAVKEISGINAKMRALNEDKKAIRKKWKANGIELGLLDATIKMAEWDRPEVRAHFDIAKRYAEWLGLPLGTQQDLFAGLGDDEVQKREWFALGQVASRLGRAQGKPPEECPPEYHQDWLKGFADEDEKSWTDAEKSEAQLEAAATIDPNAKGNVTQIADALAARPKRSRKPAVAPGTLDAPAIAVEGDDDDELVSGAPQDADASSGEVIH